MNEMEYFKEKLGCLNNGIVSDLENDLFIINIIAYTE